MASSSSVSSAYELVPRPPQYDTDQRYSHLQREGLVLRHEKSLNHLQEKMQVLRRNGSSSAMEHLGYGSKQNAADSEGGHKTSHPEKEKTLTIKSSFGLNYAASASDEEDVCPTCLEGSSIVTALQWSLNCSLIISKLYL